MRTRSGKCVRGKGWSIERSLADRGCWIPEREVEEDGLGRSARAHCDQLAAAKAFKVPEGGG